MSAAKTNGVWPTVRIGEVLRLRAPDVAVEPTQSYQFAGVYCFGRGVFRGLEKQGAEFAYRKLTRVRAEEFVYPKLMAWEGAFGVVPAECDGCHVSPEFPVFEVNTDRLSPRFLGFHFQRPAVWAAISGGSAGTNLRRRRLNPTDFLRREIPLPPLAEQNRIADLLDGIASRAARVREAMDADERDADALIISTHLHLAGDRKRCLGAILALDEDAEPITPDGSYPQVGVRGFGGGLFPKGSVAGTETTYKAFNRLYNGALVLSQVKGWEGALAICPPHLAGWFVSPEYRTFRVRDGEARPSYLASLVGKPWFWRRLSNATRGIGARRERTRPDQFLTIELPMPDVDAQKRGEQLFAKVAALRAHHKAQRADLAALHPSLLDRAFKGEL